MLYCDTSLCFCIFAHAPASLLGAQWAPCLVVICCAPLQLLDSSNGYPNLSLAIGPVFLRDSNERSFVVLLKFRLIVSHLPKVVVWLHRFERRICSRKCKAQDVKYTSRHPPPFREVSSWLPKIHRSFTTLLNFWILLLNTIHRPCSFSIRFSRINLIFPLGFSASVDLSTSGVLFVGDEI